MPVGHQHEKAAKYGISHLLAYVAVGEALKAEHRNLEVGKKWPEWIAENEAVLGFDYRKARRMTWLADEWAKLAVNGTNCPPEELDRLWAGFWGNEVAPVRGTGGTGENEWHTPAKYLAAAREVLGEIDLDPATSKAAQEVVKAKKFFTKDDDGLKQEWHGRIWLLRPRWTWGAPPCGRSKERPGKVHLIPSAGPPSRSPCR
ncbi:MAG: hypothetical protein ACLQFW_04700 [Xanthobacteraceae bacterium]